MSSDGSQGRVGAAVSSSSSPTLFGWQWKYHSGWTQSIPLPRRRWEGEWEAAAAPFVLASITICSEICWKKLGLLTKFWSRGRRKANRRAAATSSPSKKWAWQRSTCLGVWPRPDIENASRWASELARYAKLHTCCAISLLDQAVAFNGNTPKI